MTIDKVASVASAGATSALPAGPERFASLLSPGRGPTLPVAGEGGLPPGSSTTSPTAPGGIQRAETRGCAKCRGSTCRSLTSNRAHVASSMSGSHRDGASARAWSGSV